MEARLGASEVPVYLIDLPELYDRPGVYADDQGDFPDNPQRAFALCQAALQVEKDYWLEGRYCPRSRLDGLRCFCLSQRRPTPKIFKCQESRSVLTIHNLQHQGVFSHKDFQSSGLPTAYWGMDGFEHNGALNLLKGGIQHADKITTVSPTYALEIRTPEYGCGLESSLQYRGADLIGILNGIDEAGWDPQKDTALPSRLFPHLPKRAKKLARRLY